MKKLEDMKKENPYKVPEGYFDTLGDQINQKIEDEQEANKTPIIQLLKPYLWMAASVLAIALIFKVGLQSTINPEFKIDQSNSISQTTEDTDDLDFYFDSYDEISSDELIEYLADANIDTDLILTEQ